MEGSSLQMVTYSWFLYMSEVYLVINKMSKLGKKYVLYNVRQYCEMEQLAKISLKCLDTMWTFKRVQDQDKWTMNVHQEWRQQTAKGPTYLGTSRLVSNCVLGFLESMYNSFLSTVLYYRAPPNCRVPLHSPNLLL